MTVDEGKKPRIGAKITLDYGRSDAFVPTPQNPVRYDIPNLFYEENPQVLRSLV